MIKFLLSDPTVQTESPDTTKIIEDPNTRRIGTYQYNIRFCLGEGSYGLKTSVNISREGFSWERYQK